MHQTGHQRAERSAFGDRVPSPTLADSPPEAAPARGDLSWLADPEPAPAVHAPHGDAGCAGRQAFNGLIKSTHRKACGYPARTLPCFRSTYFWAYHNSASPEDPPTARPGGARGRVTKRVTITTDSSGRQRTSTDSASQVRHAAALAVRVASRLRDEEASGRPILLLNNAQLVAAAGRVPSLPVCHCR